MSSNDTQQSPEALSTQQTASEPVKSGLKPKVKFIIGVVVILLVLIIGSVLLSKRADASAPGDFLYKLDHALENIKRTLTNDTVSSVHLELDLLDERLEELKSLEEEDVDAATIEEAMDYLLKQQQKLIDLLIEIESDESIRNETKQELKKLIEEHLEEYLDEVEEMKKTFEEKQDDENSSDLDDIKDDYLDDLDRIDDYSDLVDDDSSDDSDSTSDDDSDDSHDSSEDDDSEDDEDSVDETDEQDDSSEDSEDSSDEEDEEDEQDEEDEEEVNS